MSTPNKKEIMLKHPDNMKPIVGDMAFIHIKEVMV